MAGAILKAEQSRPKLRVVGRDWSQPGGLAEGTAQDCSQAGAAGSASPASGRFAV
jgi:hypothetical protein